MLVLPVQTGRRQEPFAIEIGTDAHLDAGHMRHQDEANLLPAGLAKLGVEDGENVTTVFKPPDEIIGGSELARR